MKISITIADATPAEAAAFFANWHQSPILGAHVPAVTQCDGSGSEASYGKEQAPLNTMGNVLTMPDGSRRDPDGKEITPAPKRRVRAAKTEEPAPVVPEAPKAEDPKAEAPKAEDPKAEAPAAPAAPEEPKAEDLKPVIDLDKLRGNMQALYLMGAAGAAASMGLLKEFGVKKIAELREDQRNSFQAGIDLAVAKIKGSANG